ncbi:MAG: phage major tail tube protein [Lachnospiraceae bacterium]|nr:phage major tail tube protein [Lachnospiraceae bacterium]
MKFTSQQIPEVINNYNVYNGDGNRMVGITGATQIADLVAKLTEISGAGVAGTYNAVVIGHFDSSTQTINFRAVTQEGMTDLAPGKNVRLNLRGDLQYTDTATNETGHVGVRFVVGGQVKQFSPGNLEAGNMMGGSAQVELTYILWEFDGNPCIELDKKNNVYRVDGKDLLEAVRKNC